MYSSKTSLLLLNSQSTLSLSYSTYYVGFIFKIICVYFIAHITPQLLERLDLIHLSIPQLSQHRMVIIWKVKLSKTIPLTRLCSLGEAGYFYNRRGDELHMRKRNQSGDHVTRLVHC